MVRPRLVIALALGGAVTLAGCQVDVEAGAPTTSPSAEDVAAAELAPNDGQPTGPLAFSDPAALVVSPDGAPVALRSGPDVTFRVLAEVADGASVIPTGTGGASPSGAWIEVDAGDATGFLPAEVVALP